MLVDRDFSRSPEGEEVWHVCEMQLHLSAVIAHKERTHVFYEFFRPYFAGNMGAASASDTGNACKRLQKELMALMMNTDDGISAFPDSDNMLNW